MTLASPTAADVGWQDGAAGDHKLTLTLPSSVVRQLRRRMADEDTTLRALVLEALSQAGYVFPATEIRDRRRTVRPAGA